MKCKPCQRGVRTLVGKKLGRCATCLRLSTLGMLVGWAVSAGLYFVLPNPILLGISLFVSAAFTLLWLSHSVARIAYATSAQSETAGGAMGRREFVPTLGRALAVIGAFGLGALARGRNARADVLADESVGDAETTLLWWGDDDDDDDSGTNDCVQAFNVRGGALNLKSKDAAREKAIAIAKNRAERRCNNGSCHHKHFFGHGNDDDDHRSTCTIVKFEELCLEEDTIECCGGVAYVCCVKYYVECGCSDGGHDDDDD